MIDEVVFPEGISWGSSGGPEYSTTILATRSGHEQRNRNWLDSRGRWNVAHGIKNKAEFDQLVAFFRARGGRARAFRYKDWSDFEITNEALVRIDATRFQLVKRYRSGDQVVVRPITRPAPGTLQLAPWGEEFDIEAGVGEWQQGPMLYTPSPGNVTTPVGFTITIEGLARYDYDLRTAYPEGSYGDMSTDHADQFGSVLVFPDGAGSPPFACLGGQNRPYTPILTTVPPGEAPPRYLGNSNALYPGRSNTITGLRPADVRVWGIFNDDSYAENAGHFVVTVFDQDALQPLPAHIIDYKTGIVTFAAPRFGGVRAVAGEFHVPARFDTDFMPLRLEGPVASWEDITVVEVRE